MSLFFEMILPVILFVLIVIMLIKSTSQIVADSKRYKPRIRGEEKSNSASGH